MKTLTIKNITTSVKIDNLLFIYFTSAIKNAPTKVSALKTQTPLSPNKLYDKSNRKERAFLTIKCAFVIV